jgi:hypothetical protein
MGIVILHVREGKFRSMIEKTEGAIMQYKAIGFDPSASRGDPASSAASDLQALMTIQANDGWEFVGVQNHSTTVPGSSGCFGIGATSPYQRTLSMTVFRK